jgi:putative cell wall-binding protein
VAVGLLAGALAMFGVALAPQAGATTTVTNERLAGATRYGTAAAISANAAFAAPTTAIIATGENFPDALAAASLAGANAQAPIVLTEKAAYTAEAKSALAALKAKGVTAVTIVGGSAAVSDTVETAIKGDGFTVSRVAGDDRYETAAAIATAANTKAAAAPIGGLKAALIATGTNYPDALAGGPAAYANKLPLLLVNDTVPTETANAIATLGIKKVYILGGTAAVSSAVEAQLVLATGNPATRIAGTDRFATAAAIGDFEQATLAFPVTSAILATGINFPDALASGPLGGQLKAPIVLTASLPDASKAWLDKNSKTITKLYVAGGTASVDDATVTAAVTAAQTTGNDIPANTTVTSRPELVSAAVGATVTTGLLAGTTVKFTFDEPVVAATSVGTLFHVYLGSGNTAAARFTGSGTPTAVTGDANSLNVLFTGITSAANAGALTVATTENNAAKDLTGEGTPEGDASLTATGTSTPALAAGVTTAPDLTAVQNFRAATTTQTFVDFVFDAPATAVANTYHLIGLDGTTDLVGTLDSGGGTATHTVLYANAGLLAAGFARGVVYANTVNSGAPLTIANPLEAVDITNSGNSGTPDLVSASINFGDAINGDFATLVFDQNIATVGALSTFHGYGSNGAAIAPTNYSVSNTTPNSVLLTFAEGTLAPAVGFSVDNDAVVAVGGSNSGLNNKADEVGASNSTTTTTTAGKTASPDLTGVKRTAATDLFGTLTGAFTFAFTFDEDVTASSNAFFVYNADGTRTALTGCTVGTATATKSVVTCTTYTGLANSAAGTTVLGTVAASAVTSTNNGVGFLNPEGAEIIA